MLAQLCVPGANGWKVCYLQSTWRQSDNTLCSFFMLQSSLLISLSQLHGNATVHSTSKSSVLLHHSPVQYKLPMQQLTKNSLCGSCNSSRVFKKYGSSENKKHSFRVFKNVRFFFLIAKKYIFFFMHPLLKMSF